VALNTIKPTNQFNQILRNISTDKQIVTLKCRYGLAWEFSIFSEKLHLSRIADGNSIDPTFRNSVKYHIKSDVETTGNYDLQISNVTSDDDGVYRCTYVKGNKSDENNIQLRLKSTYLRLYFI
jgi:DUF971 family protein